MDASCRRRCKFHTYIYLRYPTFSLPSRLFFFFLRGKRRAAEKHRFYCAVRACSEVRV